MTALMGVDLGTSCGWSRLDVSPPENVSWSYGIWNCSISQFDSRSLRFERFGGNLASQLAIGVDKLFYEIVRGHRGTQAAQMYGAFLAKLQETCDAYRVPYQGIEVGTIKKFATGKGNAGKPQMIEAVKGWGFHPSCDDDADALAILRCGWETMA